MDNEENIGPSDSVADLEEILWTERTALLKGDFEALADLRQRKEDTLARVMESRDGLSPQAYADLSKIAARNQALLQHAARGIAAVRRRLLEVRDAQSGEATYGPSGRNKSTRPDRLLEKRA